MCQMSIRFPCHHYLYLIVLIAVIRHFRDYACKEQVAFLNLAANLRTKYFKLDLPAFLLSTEIIEKPGPFISRYLSCFHEASNFQASFFLDA